MIKVLIVDDEFDTRSGLKEFYSWESIGFTVIGTAENGIQALNIIEKQDVDVVLTDIVMPQMTGIQLAKILYTKYPRIKIVFLSAYGEFEYAKEALEYGVKGYIVKPTHFDEVTDVFIRIKNEIISDEGRSLKDYPELAQKNGNEVIKLAKDYMEKNYRTATLEETASYVHYNPFYLSSYFKRQTGETFTDCLIRIRMEKAAELILSNRKIYEVSEMVGYSNSHNFTRTFKAYYKTTPLNFKKHFKKQRHEWKQNAK